MNEQIKTSKFMLLFRGTLWDRAHSAEEIRKIMNQWTTWMEDLMSQGTIKGGQPLDRYEGKVVSWKNGEIIVDGPFAESKEAIGGYFLLEVDGQNEAVEIAKQCPALEYGLDVEVRRIVEPMSTLERLERRFLNQTS